MMEHYGESYFGGTAGAKRRYWQAGMSWEKYQALSPKDKKAPHNRMVEYIGPSAMGWGGFEIILDMLSKVFFDKAYTDNGETFESVLDVGCSTGVFLQHTNRAGIPGWGVDLSEYATSHPVGGVDVDQLAKVDVGREKLPKDWPKKYHVVTAFDFFEHVFEADLDRVFADIRKRANPYVAACVCSVGSKEHEWIAERGEFEGPDILDDRGQPLEWVRNVGAKTIPDEKCWQVVSGHVTNKLHSWWIDRFEAAGFEIMWKEMHKFEQLRREAHGFCYGLGRGIFTPSGGAPIAFPGGVVDQVASWGPRFIVFARVK